MHKIFAKTLFLGKKVIFLPQCHSTNDELSALIRDAKTPEGTIVYTDHQLNGRGQRGNQWEDEPGQNVLLSVFFKPNKVAIKNQFFLNLISGLAILDLLVEQIRGKEVRLKWPNDIYINDKKIAGILIESSIKGALLDSSIIGVGINLNQENFKVERATSLFLESGNFTNREEFIEELLQHLEHWYLKLTQGCYDEILSAYHNSLYWKDEMHTFRSEEETFSGIIKGINEQGRLVILTSDREMSFDVKEVQFLT